MSEDYLISFEEAARVLSSRTRFSEARGRIILGHVPKAEPLTEADYNELRDRFGEWVEFVVRDMIEGRGERWEKEKIDGTD